ncbi:MAG TPA: ATP-dependent DNA helicase [Enteractinococcus helveticum]|uniref:DNA 5'-3' helicase n=1 Tax=Enteractinococcus helveticum TaxID=1837282 RepID=A0A921FPI4_9MICC|nr:ATP-dependent DNA helicase [Enteractinococcus helveticum]HJF15550.1 ATP-dependent DNA helicase [Enteractinococcus helveticum]
MSGNQPVTNTASQTQVSEWLADAVAELGGQTRPGQQLMATEVASALQTGTHLVVQAGTGTGKSLAYLVPAIDYTLASESPVVIATATLALQSQIISRDIPRLLDTLEPALPRSIDVALLKGRANYVCKHKLHGAVIETEDDSLLTTTDVVGQPLSQLGEEVIRLRSWAEETDTGDRDDLKPGVTDEAWRQVSVSARECIGASKCPFAEECFSELARQAAAESDIIVTNHAMLAIAAFEDLNIMPEADAIIIDEAHELMDRVTSAVTLHLSASMIRSAAKQARQEAAVVATDLTDAAASMEAAFASAPTGWFAQGLNEHQLTALESVRDETRQMLSDLKGNGGTETEESNRQLVKNRLTEILETTEQLLSAGSQPKGDTVVWATRPSHFEPGQGWVEADPHAAPLLYAAPLSIAGKFRDKLLNESTTILTSATLTVGGKFDTITNDLGFTLNGGAKYKTLDVGSPFDYPRQGILYVADDLPKPGPQPSAQSHERLEQLLAASDGGALCLFSSRSAAKAAADEMRLRFGDKLNILVQGESTLSGLIDEFTEDPRACLFGTLTLWQGVDVPGETLRLVTIDRLPFPRPDDPLAAARARYISQRGGNGFMAVSASHAAVRLAQGAGRLIRSTSDRGVVAVLDSRLASAGYSGFLRASMPNFWSTGSLKQVLTSLESLSAGLQKGN